jgi:hypothetical protein
MMAAEVRRREQMAAARYYHQENDELVAIMEGKSGLPAPDGGRDDRLFHGSPVPPQAERDEG